MQEPVVKTGDANGTFDVVAVTLPSYERQLVSTASSTTTRRAAAGNSLSATGISDDGQRMVFTSAAPDLMAGAGGDVYSGFVFDQSAGTNRHVGQTPDGASATWSIRDPQLARGGRHVVFLSDQGFRFLPPSRAPVRYAPKPWSAVVLHRFSIGLGPRAKRTRRERLERES